MKYFSRNLVHWAAAKVMDGLRISSVCLVIHLSPAHEPVKPQAEFILNAGSVRNDSWLGDHVNPEIPANNVPLSASVPSHPLCTI